jgi:hypothetical protein
MRKSLIKNIMFSNSLLHPVPGPDDILSWHHGALQMEEYVGVVFIMGIKGEIVPNEKKRERYFWFLRGLPALKPGFPLRIRRDVGELLRQFPQPFLHGPVPGQLRRRNSFFTIEIPARYRGNMRGKGKVDGCLCPFFR